MCYNIYGEKDVNEKIKNILQKLENNGYISYVVGGYVRDFLLGIETYDIDICTSAEPKEVRKIFDLNNANDDNYGSVYFKDKLYNYDITTFRKENSYKDRKPVDYEYVESVEEDLKRRDFTINAMYMDISGTIHDPFGGLEDLENKTIKVVGNIKDKMIEDPLRMLRAIRFASTLNFKLDKNLELFIKQNEYLIRTLSYTRKKQELDKIFKSDNCLQGIELIKDLNVAKDLDITIPKNINAAIDPLGIWAQLEVGDDYQFSNSEKDTIDKIKKIVTYGIIDNVILYEYGLYPSIIAASILGFDREYVSDIYKNLPIYSVKDIKINGDDIISILKIKPGSKIKNIIDDIELNILHNLLPNDYESLKEYIINNWRQK